VSLRFSTSIAAVLALLLLAGSGAAAGAQKAQTTKVPAAKAQSAKSRGVKTHTVTIDGTRFDPETLTVSVGDSIVWINKDPFPHTVTSSTGVFDSDQIAPDKSWKFKAAKKGDYPYICNLHPTMKASLRVQ
jgi:plastocyanin